MIFKSINFTCMLEFFSACQYCQLMASSIWVGQCLVFSSDFHCKENNGTTGAVHLIQTFFGDISWYQETKESGFLPKNLYQVHCSSHSIFPLKWKSVEGTKHYFTQMLLAINWSYWTGGKKFINACEGSRSPHASMSLKFTRFSKKKMRLHSFLTE